MLDLNVCFDQLLNLEYTERTGILHGMHCRCALCTVKLKCRESKVHVVIRLLYCVARSPVTKTLLDCQSVGIVRKQLITVLVS